MAKKTCGECGAPRGTPHKDECSGAAHRLARKEAKPVPGGAAVLVSKTPLRRADIAEGLAVSRGSKRVVYHTPMITKIDTMSQAPPGAEIVGASSSQFEAPEPPIEITDAQKLIDGAWVNLAEKLHGGTISYMDPAVEAGMREPTENDMLVFCGPDGVPRMKMPLSVYNRFMEMAEQGPQQPAKESGYGV